MNIFITNGLANNIVPLVPLPDSIHIKKEMITIGTELRLINLSGNKEIDFIINTCASDFQELGFKMNVNSNSGSKITSIYLKIDGDKNKKDDETYRLTVDTCISIYANSPNGIFQATRTVLQLLQKGPGSQISKLEIMDKPSFGYRGVMVDCARYLHSIDFHIQTIKKLAYYKINHYMFHFSDHQSYTLPSDLYPELPTKGRSYTKKEIQRLVETAKEYHITIVPSVDVPGHAGALIRGIPILNLNNPDKIDIAKEETYKILQSLFEELLELFPGKYWHLGADEVSYPDLVNSPYESYAAWMKKLEITTGEQLLNSFINRMYDFFKNNGKEMLVWEGFNPRIEPVVNKEIIVCPFDIKHADRMPKDYINAGYRILNTSWSPLYIADKIDMTTPELLAKWNPYMFGAGRSPQPFAYWIKFKPSQISTEIIGAQMCSWNNEEKAEWGLWFGKDAGPGFPEYGRPEPRVQIFSERTWNYNTSGKSLLERTNTAYWDVDY